MLLHQRRADYKILFFAITTIIIAILLIPRTPRDLLTNIFYYIVLPTIFTTSIILLTKRT